MKKKKYLLTDVDGVLLNWVDGFVAYIKKKKIFTTTAYPTDWSLHEWLCCSPERAIEHVAAFNRTAAFSRLEPIYGSVQALKLFKEMGYTIVAITASGVEKGVLKRRGDNLRRVFGKNIFNSIHYVKLGQEKKRVLERYPRSIWVEDTMKHAVEGVFSGHVVKLLTAHHNRDQKIAEKHIERMPNWYYIWAQAALQQKKEGASATCKKK